MSELLQPRVTASPGDITARQRHRGSRDPARSQGCACSSCVNMGAAESRLPGTGQGSLPVPALTADWAGTG